MQKIKLDLGRRSSICTIFKTILICALINHHIFVFIKIKLIISIHNLVSFYLFIKFYLFKSKIRMLHLTRLQSY